MVSPAKVKVRNLFIGAGDSGWQALEALQQRLTYYDRFATWVAERKIAFDQLIGLKHAFFIPKKPVLSNVFTRFPDHVLGQKDVGRPYKVP
ncbi:MAG: hypothetical protein V4805_15085 [Pseudomonadota bacterium]